MVEPAYSFLDVAILDEVRQRFAAGDALVVLSSDLEEVIWANGPGASFLGYPDITSALGEPAGLAAVARRQIMATRGYPEIGSASPMLIRFTSGLSSQALPVAASTLRLPDGERAILLSVAFAVADARSRSETAARVASGFAGHGQFAAVFDADGTIEASTPGFDSLGIDSAALRDLAEESATEGDRLVKRMIRGGGAAFPAGVARLADEPARHLLVLIDERHATDMPPATAPVEALWTPGGPLDEHPPVDSPADVTMSASADEALAQGFDEYEIGIEAEAPQDWATDMPVPEGLEPGHSETAIAADVADAEAGSLPEPVEPFLEPAAGAISPDVAESLPIAEVDNGSVGKHDDWYFREPAASDAGGGKAKADAFPTAPQAETTSAGGLDRAAVPLRFVWRTDAEGRFSQISTEFADATGMSPEAIVGRSFGEVAAAYDLDPDNEIAGLLERRDTWSGRSVLWPVIGTDLRVPVDLAALPIYDRNRVFEGFRGFGIARLADAVVDAGAAGLEHTPPEKDITEREAVAQPTAPEDEPTAGDDPFEGEVPALAIAPRPERRESDKIIRLAEHRPAANDKALSASERSAFREIGQRLKQETGEEAEGAATAGPVADPATPEAEQPSREVSIASDIADIVPADEVPEPVVAATTSDEILPDVRREAPDVADPAVEAPRAETPGDEPLRRPRKLSLFDYVTPSPAVTDAIAKDETASPPESYPVPENVPADAHALVIETETDAPAEAAAAIAEEEPAAEPTATEAVFVDSGEFTQARDITVSEIGEEASLAVEQGEEHPGGAPAMLAEEDEEPRADQEPEPTPRTDTSILERLPVPVLIHAGDNLYYANPEFLSLSGHESLTELEQAGGLDTLFVEPYENEVGSGADHALRLRDRAGAEHPIEAVLRSVPWNGGNALMLVVRRTNEQIAAAAEAHAGERETQLKARIAEMRTIIDTATDGVVLMARDGMIRSISRPAEAMFGFDAEDVVGKPFTSLFAPESQRSAADYLNGLVEHGVASVLNDGREVIGREAQGRFIPIFMTIGRLPGDTGFCAVLRDITQWKRAEEELTQARAQAEHASSLKTDFLARVSHEIRTPLNAIIGFSELMVDEKFGAIGNERYKDYLRDINRSGSLVLDLVNDLLDISKIEAGQQEMSYEAVSLNDTLAETVALMQPQANRERVIIRSSFASRLPDVVADLRSMRQIALNILSNAIRYTPAGGQVIVSTAYETSGDVVFRVRDTGVGMSAAEIEQALKPFKQINALKRTRGDGTGLGLPLTKAMVEANRARFSITSTPGEGTLVEIVFPTTRVLAQ